MRSNTYTLVFTSIVTIVLGFFLALAADWLRDLQDLNVENDMRKNILLSLGFKPGAETPWTSDDIQKLFEENIEALVLDASGQRTEKDPKEIDSEKNVEFLPIYLDRRYENELIEGQNKGQEALEYVERIRLYYETLSLIEKNKSLGFSTS